MRLPCSFISRVILIQFLAYLHTGGASNGSTEAINLLIEKHRRDTHGFRNLSQLQAANGS